MTLDVCLISSEANNTVSEGRRLFHLMISALTIITKTNALGDSHDVGILCGCHGCELMLQLDCKGSVQAVGLNDSVDVGYFRALLAAAASYQ